VAVHIGADVLRHPRHAAWARPLSCRDTVERLSRLCQASGVRAQQALLGPDATTGRVRVAIAGAAAAIGPGGLLVLTFSGHSERPVPGEHDGGWCLHDRALRHAETAALLAAAPESARIVVIADTCYAAACAATFTGMPGSAGSCARTPPTSSGPTYAPATRRLCACARSGPHPGGSPDARKENSSCTHDSCPAAGRPRPTPA
jgi:hypothetical protein